MNLDGQSAAVHADGVEAAAYSDLFDAAPASLKARLGIDVQQHVGATLLIAPGLPTPMFNRAIGLGLAAAASETDVDVLVQRYAEAGSASWWLHWNPFAEPATMPELLQHRGFTLPSRRRWAKMLRGTQPPPTIHTDLHVAPARDDDVAPLTSAIAQAFGMPPFMADWLAALHGRPRWRVYAVTDEQRVVGGGCLFVDGDNAWLGMGSVVESHRRRGAQGALMALRIADAIAAGCEHIVTETGEAIADEPNPSLANMKRCGFATVASRLNFEAPKR